MGSRHVFFALVVLAVSVKKEKPSKHPMPYITSRFVKVLEECQHELKLNEHILEHLFHFWKLEYSLLGKDPGCAIICMSTKLDLLDLYGRMHRGNAAEFAKKHAAGDEVPSKIVTIIHFCQKKHEQDGDECLQVLEVATCCRTGLHDLNWQHQVEVIVPDVLTEI
uniref:OBP15 n=1 Tax=Helicoverpa armigera TaxID=29058 RepID=F5ANI4_HELAM|nr:OBP15 [Helicoverpa armigera]